MSKIHLLKPSHGLHLRALSRGRTSSTIYLQRTSLHTLKTPPALSPFLPAFPRTRAPKTDHSLPFLVRAIESSTTKPGTAGEEVPRKEDVEDGAPPDPLLVSSLSSTSGNEAGSGTGRRAADEYATGEFVMEEYGWWMKFMVKLRMLFAFPWERVKKGSVLSMKLRGRITDQLTSRFSSGLSLPQICENFIKAAYDPRISGIYLHIEPLSCGWGKIDEIRRHILSFKKSGKFIVGYIPICGEKEYYLACACGEVYSPPSAYVALYGLSVQASFLGGVFEKIGVEPHIQRIGKYKSAGDQLSLKSMSKENCEMLTSLLDDIYGNWIETISSTQGKTKEKVEEFLNSGVYQVERLKENGWITNTLYDDEVMSMLKDRLEQKKRKNLLMVDYGKYSRVRKWTLGLERGRDQIAIIRASGSISRTRNPLSSPGSSIIGEQLIEKIRSARESEKFKAVILRIDSPGGDALASDLMWREIRLLAASKPVIASMSDVAASGGYYMAMAANTLVAENLTLTGSIGVVTGKFNLRNLYERIGFNKEIISRGKYAELLVAEQRPFRPDESELFENSAKNVYKQFRDKAAFSRSMTVEELEQVAQGRVWTGKEASSRGLVDTIGGFSRAVAIAKQKANIPQHRQVRLVEMSKPSPSIPDIISGIASSLFGLESAVKEVLQDVSSPGAVQARMEGILFERLENSSNAANPLFSLIKDYFSSF